MGVPAGPGKRVTITRWSVCSITIPLSYARFHSAYLITTLFNYLDRPLPNANAPIRLSSRLCLYLSALLESSVYHTRHASSRRLSFTRSTMLLHFRYLPTHEFHLFTSADFTTAAAAATCPDHAYHTGLPESASPRHVSRPVRPFTSKARRERENTVP